MAPQLLRSSPPPRWDDGWTIPTTPEILRGLLWGQRGFRAARERAKANQSVGFDHWAATVESVWWLSAIEDVLFQIDRDRYEAARDADPDGRVMYGLRWVRHQHAHAIVVTGQGGPKRDFFGDGGPPFYISPVNRWRPRTDIVGVKRNTDAKAELAYDQHVGGRGMDATVHAAASWINDVIQASGIPNDPTTLADDPTVL